MVELILALYPEMEKVGPSETMISIYQTGRLDARWHCITTVSFQVT